jgi:hypothetical protein
MEEHRRRIEADHNEGIPPDEWETLEEILDDFLHCNTIRDAANAYEVPQSVIRKWLRQRGVLPPKPQVRVRSNGIKPSTYAVRVHRGMDRETAATLPAMTTEERARTAAKVRWDRRYVGH